jgi:hypothetical protein
MLGGRALSAAYTPVRLHELLRNRVLLCRRTQLGSRTLGDASAAMTMAVWLRRQQFRPTARKIGPCHSLWVSRMRRVLQGDDGSNVPKDSAV